MITLRIRGLYAAALTSLFSQHPQLYEVVQPDDEIQAHLSHPWRMDPPDITIDDQHEARGGRDILRIAGPADAVEQIFALLQERCCDVIVLRRESSQLGATYMGLVGIVSRARRRAIVYLGEQRAGILPLRYEDRDLRVGSHIPVRIEALTSEGDERLQLSPVISVPGQYAVLTSSQSVKFSKQISDEATRERLQALGEAQPTDGWGILWRTAAQEVDEALLVQEIERLTQASKDVQARLAATTTVGYVYGGEMVAQVMLSSQAKTACDALRAEILPTLPGHHKYRAQGDVYGAIVNALEKELPPDVLRARTASLSVLSSIDTMQLPIHDPVRFLVRQLNGQVQDAGSGRRLAYDLEQGWVDVRETVLDQASIPSELQLEKQPGDYTVTRFQEGSWSYIKRFHGRDGVWKGDQACLTTPVAIFSDQIHLVNLQVAVYHRPQQAPQMMGLEGLQALGKQGIVGADLLERVRQEGEAILRRFTAATSVQQEPGEAS